VAESGVEIVRGGAELLDAVRPLWLAMRDHHHQVAPAFGPPRDDEATWARGRAMYAGWTAERESCILLARGGLSRSRAALAAGPSRVTDVAVARAAPRRREPQRAADRARGRRRLRAALLMVLRSRPVCRAIADTDQPRAFSALISTSSSCVSIPVGSSSMLLASNTTDREGDPRQNTPRAPGNASGVGPPGRHLQRSPARQLPPLPDGEFR
jgi:hypothetical protein